MSLLVEVVYAGPGRQLVSRVLLPLGSTIEDAVHASGLAKECPEIRLMRAGIFGKVLPRETLLHDRDRVEFYRPLQADPKDRRRAGATRKRASR